MRPARIIPREEVEARRGLAAARAALAREVEEARAAAAAERDTILEAARNRALRDSARSAMKVIAEAEAAAEHRLSVLEPQIAALVAETVREVVGRLDRDDAVRGATEQALLRLRAHRRARITTAPDVVDAVRAGVAAADGAGAEVVSVTVDPRLESGRATLSSDRGHAEIGLDDQVAAVTEAWDGRAGGRDDDRA